MRNERFTVAAVLTVVASIIPAMASGQGFEIVVNTMNPTKVMSKQNLSKCFLKQTKTWSNGILMIPVDQAANSEIREAFSREIHDRDVASVRSFWQRQIFSGRGVPPTEKASDDEVITFVQANPGAIGYVSEDADLRTGVKVLKIAK